MDDLDSNPPPATIFPTVTDLKKAIAQQHILFTAADNDAFVPAEGYLKSIEKFCVPGHTDIKRLPGGHHAIFLEKGYEVFNQWSQNLN